MSDVKLMSILLLLFADVIAGKLRTANRFDSIKGSDSIQVTRCDIVCYNSRDKKCHNSCMKTSFVKHGTCPSSFENVSPFDQACVEFCSKDVECPSTKKCCQHSCGFTCKAVTGLEFDGYLPEVPGNVVASKKKGVRLSWTIPHQREDELVLFVLEERHHLGEYFNEALLGEWNPIHSTRNTSVILKSVLKPGYFYQFRVASVNANGTKGFSSVSKGFTLARLPIIQKPKDLGVENVHERNDTIWGLVRWKPSKSPIPIEKYKILWSYKIDDEPFKYNSQPVFVKRATVSEHKLFYQLKNLLKDKIYYIQVWAVANFGGNTLKSRKAEMVFDTSKIENQYAKKSRKSRKG